MKKRVLSIIALMCCVLETFCMPVGATNSEQDEPEIIATEETRDRLVLNRFRDI